MAGRSAAKRGIQVRATGLSQFVLVSEHSEDAVEELLGVHVRALITERWHEVEHHREGTAL